MWQGVDKELPPVNTERKFSDRVEEYDVYNDLGRLPADPKQQTFDPRPVLGDMVDVRRLSETQVAGWSRPECGVGPFARLLIACLLLAKVDTCSQVS